MAEGTSIWKMDDNGKLYTEFDFLAVIQAPDTCKFSPVDTCEGCMKVSGFQLLNNDLLQEYGYSNDIDNEFYKKNFSRPTDECFKRELESAVAASCDCFSVKHNAVKSVRCAEYLCSQTVPECKEFTVSRSTGQLRISLPIRTRISLPIRTSDCSLTLFWTSNAKSLLAPVSNGTISKKMQRLQHLKIDVDFLPALEVFVDDEGLQHMCFLVPKRCPYPHLGGWRISQCLAEINHFRANISCEHTPCYKVLKYLHEHHVSLLYYRELEPYYIKTAVLNHSITCFDSSLSCVDCVFNILRELRDAIRSGVLRVFHGKANLFNFNQNSFDIPVHWFKDAERCVVNILNLLSKFRSRKIPELELPEKW